MIAAKETPVSNALLRALHLRITRDTTANVTMAHAAVAHNIFGMCSMSLLIASANASDTPSVRAIHAPSAARWLTRSSVCKGGKILNTADSLRDLSLLRSTRYMVPAA